MQSISHPFVSRLTVYPIKSLDGVAVAQAQVRPGGSLNYDREFALFTAEGRTVNAKKFPTIQAVRADFNLNYHLVTLAAGGRADTFMLYTDSDRIAEWFSDYLGQRVELRQNTDTGFPDDVARPGPTVITEASLAAVAAWFGLEVANVRRRFRANVELGPAEPFWEEHLLAAPDQDRPFTLGAVQVMGLKACARCPVPTRDPDTAEARPQFQTLFMAQRQQHLPAYAHPAQYPHYYHLSVNTRIPASEQGKIIHVGDAVGLG
ncbi:MAG: MOSC N-terminal beta barrel domain-containing protein [Bernardetiaceae bacterium]|jgi:hypothetical protein|nr:MOSC N-terminal beta barrel domain-containing protein [Bernardetiaceae bacterium]